MCKISFRKVQWAAGSLVFQRLIPLGKDVYYVESVLIM